ncbi:Fe-S cluster assembly protein HesB [Nonomuraea sp. 10N515B]|uniref:Fe-S cluster assembly protein HesB n=1 Tax=Nonomuraea sp. 10N515B TaxID=3457422 RepID=UPI003FCE56D9
MLTLTDNAAGLVRVLASRADHPDQAGLRIAPRAHEQGGNLTVAITGGPDAGDQVVEIKGIRVFLAPEAAERLDDKYLDVEPMPGGSVSFRVSRQEP